MQWVDCHDCWYLPIGLPTRQSAEGGSSAEADSKTSFRRAMTLLPSLPNLLARKLGRPDDHTVMRARVHGLNSVQPGDRTDHRSNPNRAPKAGKSLTVM